MFKRSLLTVLSFLMLFISSNSWAEMYEGYTPSRIPGQAPVRTLTNIPASAEGLTGLKRTPIPEPQPVTGISMQEYQQTQMRDYESQLADYEHAQKMKSSFIEWATKRGASLKAIQEALALKGWDKPRPGLPQIEQTELEAPKTMEAAEGIMQGE